MTRMGSPCVCDRFIIVFGWTNVVPTLHIAASKPEVILLPVVVARWLTSADNCFGTTVLVVLCHAVVILVAAIHVLLGSTFPFPFSRWL